jgi:hypothetical protein
MREGDVLTVTKPDTLARSTHASTLSAGSVASTSRQSPGRTWITRSPLRHLTLEPSHVAQQRSDQSPVDRIDCRRTNSSRARVQ